MNKWHVNFHGASSVEKIFPVALTEMILDAALSDGGVQSSPDPVSAC